MSNFVDRIHLREDQVREHGNPKPRLTTYGYTVRAGSPTRYQAHVRGRWRRVYVWQFSNAGTAFVKEGKNNIIVSW